MHHSQELVGSLGHLRQYALHLTRSRADAEDLVQSTFLCALETEYMPPEYNNPQSWATDIMYDLCITAYHNQIREESTAQAPLAATRVDPDQNHIIELQQISMALNSLPDCHREIIILICIHGTPYKEAATRLSIPVGTVRSRLARARRNLRLILTQAAHAVTNH